MNPQQWIDSGIAVIPCYYRSKRPVFAWKQYQGVLPSSQNVDKWFRSRFVNMAVITGHRGLTIVDFDDWDIWQMWKNWITAKYPDILKKTYLVKTRRGMHVYFFINDAPERTMKMGKIDIKAGGGYCLCPTSIHPTGHKYKAINTELKIATIDHLSDIFPSMFLEQTRQDIVIPKCNVTQHHTTSHTNTGEIDIWNISPQSGNGVDKIQWIKQNVQIIDFFPNARQTGREYYMTRCPIHDDHEASASINIESNRIKCFRGCFGDRGTDVLDFYCLLKKISRNEGIKQLYKR